ncbi:MAG TPA: chondroitinase-B domain-containing protein, partial [Prosthecobacter sp.]
MRPLHLLLSLAAAATSASMAKDIPVANAAAFAEAAKTLTAGDTLVLKDGTWADARLKLKAMGTAEKPVIVRAETAGKVLLTGDSRISIAG